MDINIDELRQRSAASAMSIKATEHLTIDQFLAEVQESILVEANKGYYSFNVYVPNSYQLIFHESLKEQGFTKITWGNLLSTNFVLCTVSWSLYRYSANM